MRYALDGTCKNHLCAVTCKRTAQTNICIYDGKTQMYMCLSHNFIHTACICISTAATKQDSCYILIFESAANCFSFALAGVSKLSPMTENRQLIWVCYQGLPHNLVKARLPVYLSLSLCSEGEQTRPTYIHLQKLLAACTHPCRAGLSLKSRSQVNWGESHVLFVSQHI